MRFERQKQALYQFKKHLGKLPASWKNKPQVAMKLPDFCLTPLLSSLLSKLLSPPPNPSVGCWDPRAWSVYIQTPNVRRLRQKRSNSVLVYVVLTWAPLTTFQIALPTTAHTRYKIQFRPYSRTKTPSISSFSQLCRVAFVASFYRMNSLILAI